MPNSLYRDLWCNRRRAPILTGALSTSCATFHNSPGKRLTASIEGVGHLGGVVQRRGLDDYEATRRRTTRAHLSMGGSVPELRYHSQISDADLNAELDRLWDALTRDPSMRAELAGHGLDIPDAVVTQPRSQIISLRRDSAGLDPVTTAVVIAFAPPVAKMVGDLWTIVLLPRIKRRFGQDALTTTPEAPKRPT